MFCCQALLRYEWNVGIVECWNNGQNGHPHEFKHESIYWDTLAFQSFEDLMDENPPQVAQYDEKKAGCDDDAEPETGGQGEGIPEDFSE